MPETLQKREPPRRELWFWAGAVIVSLLLHVIVVFSLTKHDFHKKTEEVPEGYVKLDLLDNVPPEDQEVNRILEAPLKKTEAPPQADYLGLQDHIAKKKMKVKDSIPRPKMADPGQTLKKQSKSTSPPSLAEQTKQERNLAKDGGGFLEEKKVYNKRNSYENLLAYSLNQLADQQLQTGYLDYIDDLAEDGDAIDLNTQEYRYIGYFTTLRKAIELVWVYPSEAVRRGLDGRVRVKFIIQENGKVSKVAVMESSGHLVLDEAIISAIKLAAPFSPLPKGFSKAQLVIKGNFSYILSASAGSY